MLTFSKDLIQTVPYGQDVLWSPASVSSALMRSTLGADGSTRIQMLRALGFMSNKSNEQLARVIIGIEAMLCKAGISVANALYYEQTFQLLPAFLQQMSKIGGIIPTNFVGQPDASRLDINKWVGGNTNQKIPNLLPEGSIDADTVSAIVNALYLKKDWRYMYDVDETTEGSFWGPAGEIIVSFMNQTNGKVPFYQGEMFSALIMPYAETNMIRLYILPNHGVSLQTVEDHIYQVGLQSIMAQMAATKNLEISVPKFQLRWGTKNLVPNLEKLGMIDAFTTQANFGRMEPGPLLTLYISGVYHQAFMIDNEFGSEMTAGTTVVNTRKGGLTMPTAFIANRPFLLFNVIPVKDTLIPVFAGRVYTPQSPPRTRG